jgi:hypothetical protein
LVPRRVDGAGAIGVDGQQITRPVLTE